MRFKRQASGGKKRRERVSETVSEGNKKRKEARGKERRQREENTNEFSGTLSL